MPPRRAGHNVMKQKPKAKPKLSVSPSVYSFLSKALQLAFVVSVIVAVVMLGWQYIYKLISESYKPNAQLFSACDATFLSVKAKPMYGVVFKTAGAEVKELFLTAPSGVSGLKSIELKAQDWVPVYFSKNFTSTQVGEFVRLSRLETGEVNYCYVLEQLALTSGIPIEYVIVEDKEAGLSSSLTVAETQEILSLVEKGDKKRFNSSLLQIRELDDNSKVAVVTFDAFKEQFPAFFEITDISQEQAFVEVYNATVIEGYASIFSRKWAMLGIDISRVGNATHEPVQDKMAVIYVKNETSYSRTLAMIKSSFAEGRVEIRVGRPPGIVTTGDIVVFLLNR